MKTNSKLRPKAGLLPLYLKLYDDVRPGLREKFSEFLDRICAGLAARGVEIRRAPVCRLESECAIAVANFEAGEVDAIVTIHLAYSPSLELAGVLSASQLPVILLDTTMDAGFGCGVAAEKIMFNHGVHGVMDLASVLRRNGKSYDIAAGHDSDPMLFDRAANLVRAAVAARELRDMRAVRLGPSFPGMGDFAVADGLLAARFGTTVEAADLEMLEGAMREVTDGEIDAEISADLAAFEAGLEPEIHRRSVHVGLGLRRLLERGAYDAMSVNFQVFSEPDRIANTMPFLEISKAMGRGIGYAGEGDLLTALLTGALTRGFGAVTFTEVFCADWAGDTLFLSHMGEINPAVAGGRPLLCHKPAFLPGMPDVALLTCAVRPGPATLVNLAPGPGESFRLLVAPVEVLPETGALDPPMRKAIRAWIRPALPVARFLETYSQLGGTHHNALVLGDTAEALASFGKQIGAAPAIIQ